MATELKSSTCSICSAQLVKLGVLYCTETDKLARVLVCSNGHTTEVQDPGSVVAWLDAAKKHALYSKVTDNDVLPYDMVTLAKRRGDKWSITKQGSAVSLAELDTIKLCPFCKAGDVSVVKDAVAYTITCDSCDTFGPEGNTLAVAIGAWNADRS